jgi:GTPase SAR1 family protein
MKISKIYIKDFHQFKDFTLDLTYPKGHEKQGQPLDKVCFIGQSGTGKTSLLEMIPCLVYQYEQSNLINSVELLKLIENMFFDVHFGMDNEYCETAYYESTFELRASSSNEITMFGGMFSRIYKEWISTKASKLIYFPANLNYNLDVSTENKLENRVIIDFSKDNVATVWSLILEKIKHYQEQELKIRQDISKVVEKSSSDINAIQKAVKELETWKQTEFNPIKDVGDNCLNPLLEKFKSVSYTHLRAHETM